MGVSNENKPRSFESKGRTWKYKDKSKSDTFARIYDSMLLSDSYKDLKMRQRCLYMACKAQFHGKRKPGADYPGMEEMKDTDLFYMPFVTAVEYGIYTESMKRTFYEDMRALEEHGFIKKVAQGGGWSKKKNIWRYSADWKTWTSEK